MVVVAMSEHRGNDRSEVNPRGAAALQELAAAEAAVYQKDTALRLDAIRVSRASARKGDDLHDSPPQACAARLFLNE